MDQSALAAVRAGRGRTLYLRVGRSEHAAAPRRHTRDAEDRRTHCPDGQPASPDRAEQNRQPEIGEARRRWVELAAGDPVAGSRDRPPTTDNGLRTRLDARLEPIADLPHR